MEAVERLAAEAGLEVPKPSPEAAEAERKRLDLGAVLDAAQASYQRRLFLPEGRHALAYLRGRGLSEETIRRFGLGWSGEGSGALAADLGRDGVTPDQLVDAGLMRRDDETGRAFDLFFNRVMFPIRDRRGRVISFGGRILGDGQPKYVNGPETALFSKRRTLYALDLAREAVRGGAPLVVVEGYMDVIALGTGRHRRRRRAARHRADRGAARGAVAARAGADPVLRRRCRRQPRRGARRRTGAAAAGAGPHAAARQAARRRGPRHAGAPPGRRRHARRAGRRRAAGRSAVRPAARDRRRGDAGAACGVPGAAGGGRAAHPRPGAGRRVSPRRCSTGSSPAAGAGRRAARRRGPLAAVRSPAADAVAAERCRILTAILLRHPILLRDVEHAYRRARPAARRSRRCATALHEWAETRRNP